MTRPPCPPTAAYTTPHTLYAFPRVSYTTHLFISRTPHNGMDELGIEIEREVRSTSRSPGVLGGTVGQGRGAVP